MFVKMKCYRLKKEKDVDKYLEERGFKKNAVGNYTRNVDGLNYVIYYTDTQRFVFRGCGWREGRARKVKKYIKDLILFESVEKVTFYEWWAYIGRWQNYSDEKIERIEKKLEELNRRANNETSSTD